MDTGPRVICGFPGVGKTTLFQRLKAEGLPVLDSDSSQFDKSQFPANYINHIKNAIASGHWVFCSTHKVVREALHAAGISYVLCYPIHKYLKEEYIQRYIDRGSPEAFIKLMESKWDEFFDDVASDLHGITFGLGEGEFMERMAKDIISRDEKMKRHIFTSTCPTQHDLQIGQPTHSVDFLNGFMAGKMYQELAGWAPHASPCPGIRKIYQIRVENLPVISEIAHALQLDVIVTESMNPQLLIVTFTPRNASGVVYKNARSDYA